MRVRQELLSAYLENSGHALSALKKEGLSFLTSEMMWQLLCHELDCEIYTDVIHHDLSSNKITGLIRNHFIKAGYPLCHINFSIELIADIDSLEKARVKSLGEIWYVHKNDPDNFPSNPHAHNYIRNLKLHLGNGMLFRKKDQVDSINRKKLQEIRQKIVNALPSLTLPDLEV